MYKVEVVIKDPRYPFECQRLAIIKARELKTHGKSKRDLKNHKNVSHKKKARNR